MARRLLAPGVVHQDAAHGLGEDGEELHPAFELHLAAAQEAQDDRLPGHLRCFASCKQWISALRLQISSDLPSIALKANVYAVGK